MPGFPERFTPKDNQFIDGVHTTVDAYTWNNWYNPYDFTEAFNGLVDVEGTSASDGNYDFKCATDGILINRVWNGTEYRYQIEFDYSVLTQNEIFELIGGTYDINVSYTYPRISSESDDHNYTVSGESFKVKLDNDEVLSADWLRLNADKSPVKFNLTYGQNNSQLTIGSDAATCWINIKKDCDAYNFSPAMIGYEAVKEGEIHLISSNGGVDEYFTVEFDEATNAFVFTPVVGALRPAEDVNSTLQFVLVDAFGHEHPVSLANFVVKVQQ